MANQRDPPDLNAILVEGAKRQSILSTKAQAARSSDADSTEERPLKRQKTKNQKSKSDPPPPSQNAPAPALTLAPSQPAPAVISVANPPTKNKFSHRPDLPARPTEKCAADHSFFKKNHSLVFSFLIVHSLALEEEGELIKAELQCAKCALQSPSDGMFRVDKGNFGGSTGRFIKHFKTQHPIWWADVTRIDEENGVTPKGKMTAPTNTSQMRLEDAIDNVSPLRIYIDPQSNLPFSLSLGKSFMRKSSDG